MASSFDRDWLGEAVTAVGQRRTQAEQEAAATYVAMARQQRARDAADLARWSGLPVETVTRNPETIRDARRLERDVAIIATQPRLQTWIRHPTNAASAHATDDVENLGAFSTWFGPSASRNILETLEPDRRVHIAPPDYLRVRTSREVLDSARRATRNQQEFEENVDRNRPAPSIGSIWTGISVDAAEGLRQQWIGAKMFMADAIGATNIIEDFREDYERSQLRALSYRPRIDSGLGSAAYGGVTSFLQTLPALMLAPFTDGASLVTLFGVQAGTGAYGRYRTRGATRNEALVGGTLEGGIEGVTEILPTNFLLKNFGTRGAGGFLFGFLGREMLGEQLATLGQDAVDTAIANPTATWDQYWADRPRAAFDTAVGTIIASGAIAGGSVLYRNIRNSARDLDAVTHALAGTSFLDQAIALAEASKIRQEDPQGFRQFVETQTAGTPLENVYVPAEAVRSLMQSANIDIQTDPFWSRYAGQIEEALPIGGDVVIPMADAVIGFAESGQWDTLRDSTRLSPGGISRAEAQSIAQSYQDLMIERGEDVARQVREATEAEAPVRRVYDTVLQQARSAGMSLNSSRAYADLFAQRYAARAEQRGNGATAWTLFEESVGGIVGEAPSIVRQYEATDQLDRLVASMRRGKEAPSERRQFGPSLLEWIAGRGGVEDPGGDLKSMGLDAWHTQAPFRRRLIRESADAAQGSIPGVGVINDKTLDMLAVDAWEAGYFPEFAERPAVNDLIDAMGEEYRGSPRYSSERRADSSAEADAQVRQAADELRAFLEEREIDPDTASIEEIREAVATVEAEFDRTLAQVDAWRRWDEPPEGMSDIILNHNGPANLPRGRPMGMRANYFGTREFSEATGLDFGDWRYTYWVPQAVADKLVRLMPDDARGREVAGIIAERQWPDEPEYAAGLREGNEDAWLDFYETWADSDNLVPVLEELGYLGAQHRAEYALLPEAVEQLVDRRSGPDDGTMSFYQSQPHAPRFYSALRRAVEVSKTAKAPAAQWLATFRNASGVKAEEVEWSGLVEWLEEQPGSVSRTDIEQFLATGGIVVDEVVLGYFDEREVQHLTDKLREQEIAQQARDILDRESNPFEDYAGEDVPTVVEVMDDGDLYESGQAQVVAWEFDGIEYDTEDAADQARAEAVEVAVQEAEAERYRQLEDQLRSEVGEEKFRQQAIEELNSLGQYPDWTSLDDRDRAQAAGYRELLLTLPLGQGRNPAKAPETHWQVPGVVAHVRFLVKRDLEGRPVLFVEEVQSDWHQKGRDHGYEAPPDPTVVADARTKLEAAHAEQKRAREAVVALATERGILFQGLNDLYRNEPLDVRAHHAMHGLSRHLQELVVGRKGDPEAEAEADGIAAVMNRVKDAGRAATDASDFLRNVSSGTVAATSARLQDANRDFDTAQRELINLAGELRAYKHVEAPLNEQAARSDELLAKLHRNLDNPEAKDPFAISIAAQHDAGHVIARISEARGRYATAQLRQNEARQAYATAIQGGGIPDAPFKTTWPALVMKRVIRWAADNGFQTVAWTTGDQQNERYSLDTALGGYVAIHRFGPALADMTRWKAGEELFVVVVGDSIAEDRLQDEFSLAHLRGAQRGLYMTEANIREIFGEDLGGRLVKAADDPEAIDPDLGFEGYPYGGEWASIRGEGLRIGGEGMRAFYDRNLVNITNDIIKRHGARVGKMRVVDADTFQGMQNKILWSVAQEPRAAAVIQPEYEEAQREAVRLFNEEADPADIMEARDRVSRLSDELSAAWTLADLGTEQWAFPVTDKLREAAQAGFSLFQGGEDKPRARIDFDRDNKAIIRLFEGRDLSSLLHEGGHLWLEELKADAQRPDAPAQVKADWETVRAWFRANGHKVGPNGQIPTDAHEMWARATERYFMEGKAPSSALQRAFSNFRAWLLRIYQVVQNLNTPLTDDVRQVMDRLFATQAAIDDMSLEAENALLFKSADQAGMTAAEFDAYRASVQQTRSEAFDALLYRTMENIRRSRLADWKRERKGVRAEVDKEVRSRPEFRALALLRGIGGERVQLNREAFVAEYGSDALALMPRGVPPTIVEAGGVHPQVLAERSGFRSAGEMVDMLMGIERRQRELRAAGDRRSVLAETIDLVTDNAMRERHGDPLTDGSIEEEALAAIHNDARAEVIGSEIRALGRKSKRSGDLVPTPWQVVKSWAEGKVREGKVSEQASAAALARHRRNEAKAARAAEAAILKGDVDEAYRQKQAQLHHHALLRAAKEAKDQVDAIVTRLGKFAKARSLPSMDPEYLERIHQLLEDYDFKRRSLRSVQERQSFAAWAASKEAEGEEVYVPPRLEDARAVNFSQLEVQDLIALDDAVASVAHLGRRKRKLLAAKEEADLEELVAEALESGNKLPPRKQSTERNEPNNWRRHLRRFDALIVKMEFLADQLDGNNPNGVFNRLLVRGATDAANEKERLVDKVLRPLVELYHGMSKDQQRRSAEMVVVPELVTRDPETGVEVATTFKRSDILAIALNIGNESNLEKMLRGESRGLSEENAWTIEKVRAVLDRELNQEDWQFVQAVWRQVDLLWPDIVRAEKEITGIAPEKVEPRIVETKFGAIQGGYYPVVYDPTRSAAAAANYEDDAAKLLGQMGRVVSTPKGHTITRTNAAAPLLLNLEAVLLNHVQRVTTRIAYGRYVRDVLKFTNHPKIRDMVTRKLGPEYHAQFKAWLRRQVNDAALDTATLQGLDYWLRKFRINATMVGLGFRLTTMAAQTAGLTNSASEIGARWVAVGMAEATANAGSIRSFVFERSPEMSTRVQQFDRDVRAFFSDLTGERSRLDTVRAMGFWGIGNVQFFAVDLPTWLGAYRKGLDEGMSEEEAAAYGDKVVRRSQGSGRPKDLSAIQDSAEGYRILTLFYSWFNVLYNKQRDTIHQVRTGDYRRASMNVAWLMMAAPLLAAFITGDWPEDEESWGAWAARKVFFGMWLGIPGIRDVAGNVEREVAGKHTFPTTTPFVRAFDEISKPIHDAIDAARGEPVSDRWLQNAITAPGYFVGLPTGQAGAASQYILDVFEGDQHPQGVGDVVAGVARGPRQSQEVEPQAQE